MILTHIHKDDDINGKREIRLHDVELSDGHSEAVIEIDGINRDGIALNWDEAIVIAKAILERQEVN